MNRAGATSMAVAIASLACGPALADAPSAMRGAGLVAEKGCGGCHVIPGVAGADGVVGPPLNQIGRRVFIAGVLRNSPADMAAFVLNPQRYAPGGAMPAVGLTPREAIDVAAFLESLH